MSNKIIRILTAVFCVLCLAASLQAKAVRTAAGFNAEKRPVVLRDGKEFTALGITYHVMEYKNTWKSDLAGMKKLGVNTIRIDLGWDNIETADNVFNFSDLDTFIGLAEKEGFLLFVSLAPNSHKRWLPEWMISGPFKGKTWQMLDQDMNPAPGGWANVPSPQDKTYQKYYARFQSAVITHIRTNAGILGYVLYNEPHFPSGKDEGWYDYNPSSLFQFREWLGKKYYGKTEKLNMRWGTSYKKITEAEPPRSIPADGNDLPDNIRTRLEDWGMFLAWSWGDLISRLVDNAKQADPDHVVMVTEMPWWFWGEGVKGGVAPDIYTKADIIGIDIYPSLDPGDWDTAAATVNMLMSMYQYKKPVWLSEINEKKGNPSREFLTTIYNDAVKEGACGLLFFEWSDANSHIDGGAYGVMMDNSTENPEFGYLKNVLQQIKDSPAFKTGVPKPSACVLWSANNMIQTYNEMEYAYCYRGVYTRMRDLGLTPRMITEEEVLNGLQVPGLPLFIPSMKFLKKTTSRIIESFLQKGGRVMADAGFGIWSDDEISPVKKNTDPRPFGNRNSAVRTYQKGEGPFVLQGASGSLYIQEGEKLTLKDNALRESLTVNEPGTATAAWDNASPAGAVLPFENGGTLFYSGIRVLDGRIWEYNSDVLSYQSALIARFLNAAVSKDVPQRTQAPVKKGTVQVSGSAEKGLIPGDKFDYLVLPYNQDFIARSGDLSGTGYDLPGEDMGPFNQVMSCMKGDADFLMAGADDKQNTLECAGQKLLVNKNKYRRIHILGCSHSKAVPSEIVLKYRNRGRNQILPFFLEDWWGAGSSAKETEHCAMLFNHYNGSDGAKEQEVHLVHYVVDLLPYANLEWIKLPNNNKLRILAVSLEKKDYFKIKP